VKPKTATDKAEMKQRERKRQRKRQKQMSDPYLSVVQEQWPNILMLYKRFEDKKPIMLFDIQEQRIYAYPYVGFKADLSERSQTILEQQYEKALADEKIVVFVRDNDQKKLVSYSIAQENIE
jgi:hypothetical protein